MNVQIILSKFRSRAVPTYNMLLGCKREELSVKKMAAIIVIYSLSFRLLRRSTVDSLEHVEH